MEKISIQPQEKVEDTALSATTVSPEGKLVAPKEHTAKPEKKGDIKSLKKEIEIIRKRQKEIQNFQTAYGVSDQPLTKDVAHLKRESVDTLQTRLDALEYEKKEALPSLRKLVRRLNSFFGF